jgi:hypothetical protein
MNLGLLMAAVIAVPAAYDAQPPAGPPPQVAGSTDSPPPAWIETSVGSAWLAFSTYCWKSTCADFIPRRCPDKRTPTLRLRRGETVRFHFGFRPKSVELGVGRGKPTTLAARRVTSWRATGGGLLSVFVRVRLDSMNADASYAACILLRN